MTEPEFKDSFMFADEKVRFYKFPPGNETIPREAGEWTVKTVGERTDCILLGEPGSGLRNVFQWFVDHLGESFVNIKHNLMEFAVVHCDDDMRKARAEGYIERLRKCTKAHECLVVLREWVSKAEMCRLVLYKPEPTLSQYFAHAFRALRDEGRETFKLTIFTTTDDAFVDQAVQSGYFSLCTVYRMSRINRENIADWCKGKKMALSGAAIGHILRITGGQPTLFVSLLDTLKSINADPESWEPEDFDLAFDLMLCDLPHPIELWIEDLRKRIKQSPELRDRLEKYLSGKLELHRGIPAADRGLFISGWLGVLDEGWGIVSDVHRYLIRKVLLEK